jgi:hypothetical protein
MFTYRLDPIADSRDDWLSSCIRERLWVRAGNTDEAREKVARATLITKEGADRHAPLALSPWQIALSPWRMSDLSTCVMDTAGPNVPEEKVVKADGTSVDLTE